MSAPIARWDWNQNEINPMATAMAKNGATLSTSARFTLPRCHHTSPSRTNGIGATTVLLSNARKKAASARPYQRHEETTDDGQDAPADTADDRDRTKHDRLAR